MWGIVEQVIDNKIYVIFEDRTRKYYINENNLDIKENYQVYINNGKIEQVKSYNEELYNEILSKLMYIEKNNNWKYI